MTSSLDDALQVLLDPALEPIVELVALRRDGAYEAHAVDGMVRFERDEGGALRTLAVEGRDPLGDGATDRFSPLADEVANRHPHRTINAYPYAREQIAQVYDHASPPDLVVLHTAAHHWAEQGGHIGEHGSMGVVQARAPFVIAGRGVRAGGMVDRHARLVDVAPTVAALMGVAPLDDAGTYLAGQDGTAMADLLDPTEHPDHVVGFLLDGTNPNVLYDVAAHGGAPNIARLMAMGTSFAHGVFSSLPTVTLANHTTALTGRHPGRHGILHNAWWDRAERRQVITNDAANWATAMKFLTPGTETLHDAVRRTWPDAFTVSINEPADAGARYSTFDLMRRGVRMDFPRTPDGLPHSTERFVRPFKDYGWYTQVDHHGLQQALGVLGGSYLGDDYPLPRFCWFNLTLTDSAFHEGGPHSDIARASIVDTDGRIGEVLALLEALGIFDRCAFYLVADHGMEESNPDVRGDWDAALTEAGIDFRDEAYGFVYLNP
ncbi:MAG TPA: alkaline phosphatase family protein [Acidimicrobiales bacterium]